MIRVLLAEDQTLVRRGIVTLLGMTSDIEVTAEASDGDEALNQALKGQFDLALFDIRMPKLSGTQVLQELQRRDIRLPAIMLTTFDEDELFLEAVQAGAQGFLMKDISVERLAAAIRAVVNGGLLLQPAVTERVLRIVRQLGNRTPNESTRTEPLTPRERAVLRLIAAGYSNREIATSLKTTEGTIKNYASSVMSKLGARDRTRAVIKGIELGLF